MKEFGLKICLFLFLAALLSGQTNALGTVTGAITGSILLWPLYRNALPALSARSRGKAAVESVDTGSEQDDA